MNVEKVLDGLQKTDDNLYRTIFESEPISSTYGKEASVG